MCRTQHDSSTQSNINVGHSSPEKTTNSVLPEQKHEPIEFVEGNLIVHRSIDSTVANSAISPQTDLRFKIIFMQIMKRTPPRKLLNQLYTKVLQKDFSARKQTLIWLLLCNPNKIYQVVFQAALDIRLMIDVTRFDPAPSIERSNSYIDDNLQEVKEFSDEFIAKITKNSTKITEANQNHLNRNSEDKDTFVGDSEKSKQPSSESANTTLSTPKQYSPVHLGLA
ncbi:hypothetical protein ACTXT7_008459 [Hymenolepis weldensis]